MSLKSDLNKMVREFRRLGWSVVKEKGHYKWTPPGGGPTIYSGSTPGDQRSLKNTLSQLRRAARTAEFAL